MASVVDFLRPQRGPLLGWVLLVLGVVALSAAIVVERQWSRVRAEQETAHRQAEEMAQRARDAARQPRGPTLQEQRLGQIAPALRQPWLPMLRLIENATEPPVFLLGVNVHPDSGEVHLDGEAPSFSEALAYARALDEESLTTGAQVRSHDTLNDGQGRQVVRFRVVVRWSVR